MVGWARLRRCGVWTRIFVRRRKSDGEEKNIEKQRNRRACLRKRARMCVWLSERDDHVSFSVGFYQDTLSRFVLCSHVCVCLCDVRLHVCACVRLDMGVVRTERGG